MNKLLVSIVGVLFLYGCGGSSPRRDGAGEQGTDADGTGETPADGAAKDALIAVDGNSSSDAVVADGGAAGDAKVSTSDGGSAADATGAGDGAVVGSDASVVVPDAATTGTDASVVPTDGAAVEPDAATVEPDAAVAVDAVASPDTTESDSSPLGFPDAVVCQGVCVCPPADPAMLFVDPVAGSDVAGASTPTGASSPTSCRFKTITKALMAATASTKTIVVGSASLPVTLTGEIFPMTIPAGVTVTTGDATPTPANYTLPIAGGSTAASIVLGNGSSLVGFTVTVAGALADSKALSCPSGATTLRGVTLTGASNAGNGLLVGETARCTATLEDVSVSGFAKGVLVGAGGLVATRLAADGNAQYGLHVRDGDITTVTINGGHFNSNMVDGLRTDRGTLVATGFAATKNKGCGVNVRGGVATMHQAMLNANGDLGLLTIGATTTVDDGSQLSDNGASGVRTEGGTLIVGGATGGIVDLSRNGVVNALYGVNIDAPGAGTEIVITRALMTENYGYGIKVVFQTPGGSVKVSDTELAKNRLGGIVVRAAEPTTAVPSPLIAVKMNIHDNGSGGQTGFGVNMLDNDGSTAATIRNSVIKDNGDVGVWTAPPPAGHTTWLALEGNDIQGNNTTAGRAAGGIYFAGPATLASFKGNLIHDNKGDEVGFAAAPEGGGAWVLHGATGCTDPAAINQIGCYGAGNVGLRVIGSTAVMVDAQSVSWTNASPTAADYVAGAGSVNVTGACAAATVACR